MSRMDGRGSRVECFSKNELWFMGNCGGSAVDEAMEDCPTKSTSIEYSGFMPTPPILKHRQWVHEGHFSDCIQEHVLGSSGEYKDIRCCCKQHVGHPYAVSI